MSPASYGIVSYDRVVGWRLGKTLHLFCFFGLCLAIRVPSSFAQAELAEFSCAIVGLSSFVLAMAPRCAKGLGGP